MDLVNRFAARQHGDEQSIKQHQARTLGQQRQQPQRQKELQQIKKLLLVQQNLVDDKGRIGDQRQAKPCHAASMGNQLAKVVLVGIGFFGARVQKARRWHENAFDHRVVAQAADNGEHADAHEVALVADDAVSTDEAAQQRHVFAAQPKQGKGQRIAFEAARLQKIQQPQYQGRNQRQGVKLVHVGAMHGGIQCERSGQDQTRPTASQLLLGYEVNRNHPCPEPNRLKHQQHFGTAVEPIQRRQQHQNRIEMGGHMGATLDKGTTQRSPMQRLIENIVVVAEIGRAGV